MSASQLQTDAEIQRSPGPSTRMPVDGEQQSTEEEAGVANIGKPAGDKHDTLKYHLLGPSLTKAGQDSVDQQKVCLAQVLLDFLLILDKGL